MNQEKMDGWTEVYGGERAYFPRVGEIDTFLRSEQPVKDEGFPGKYRVRTKEGRLVSVYQSQIWAIGKYFAQNTKNVECRVAWVSENVSGTGKTRVVPQIPTK